MQRSGNESDRKVARLPDDWSEDMSCHVDRGARAALTSRKPDGSMTLILAHGAQKHEIAPPLSQAAGFECFPTAFRCAGAVLQYLGYLPEWLLGAPGTSEPLHGASQTIET
jgi:hypothetical protein